MWTFMHEEWLLQELYALNHPFRYRISHSFSAMAGILQMVPFDAIDVKGLDETPGKRKPVFKNNIGLSPFTVEP